MTVNSPVLYGMEIITLCLQREWAKWMITYIPLRLIKSTFQGGENELAAGRLVVFIPFGPQFSQLGPWPWTALLTQIKVYKND